MKRSISVFSLLLTLVFLFGLQQPLQAAKKKLSLVENDENVDDPDYCLVPPVFCIEYGSKDTLEVTVSTDDQLRPVLFAFIVNPDDGTRIWESTSADISFIGPNAVSAPAFTYEIVLDLSSTSGTDGRYKIGIHGFKFTPGSFSNGGGSNSKTKTPDYYFPGTVICVNDNCSVQNSNCPCEGRGLGFGLMAGQQNPRFDPTAVGATDLAFNTTNKFVGMQFHTRPKGIYYQAELQLSQLNFNRTDTLRTPTGGAPVLETKSHALQQIYLSPLQFRLRLGKLGSVGVGGAVSYVFAYQVDQQDTNFPGSTGDKLEPEIFGDVRLGNARKGFQLGYRISRRWSGLDDITGDTYRLGKVYLAYSF